MINGVGNINSNKYMATQGQTTTNNANATTVPIGQEGSVSSDDSEKKNDNKLKLALIGLGVLALGAAGAAIYIKTKKKLPTTGASDSKNVSEQVSDIQKNIKKFLNSAGESVDNVKLQKGKAVLDDGSGFSGILETVNGKGQEIVIKYQDGFMAESTINGKLFKKFENLQSKPSISGANKINYSRAQGVTIKTFVENGNLEKEVSHLYDKNGKISRSYSEVVGEWPSAIDFKDGKIVAKTAFGPDGVELAEVFDKDGNVIKKIKNNSSFGEYSVVDILPDGSKKERKGYLKYDRVATPAMQYDDKMRVDKVTSCDSKGKIKESVSSFCKGESNEMQINYADGSILTVSIPKKLEIKNGDTILPRFDYLGPEGSNSDCYAMIDSLGKNVAIYKYSQEDLESLSRQVKKLEAKAKEEGIDFPYERMEKYLAQIFNL